MQHSNRTPIYVLLAAIMAVCAYGSKAIAQTTCGDGGPGTPLIVSLIDITGPVNDIVCTNSTVTIHIQATDTDQCQGCEWTTCADGLHYTIEVQKPPGNVIQTEDAFSTSPMNVSVPIDIVSPGSYVIVVAVNDTCTYYDDPDPTPTELSFTADDCLPCEQVENQCPAACDDLPPVGPDCNNNLISDACDIQLGTSLDCNGNNIPDECDIAVAFSIDCDSNGIPDECERIPGLARDFCQAAKLVVPDVIYSFSTGDATEDGINSCDTPPIQTLSVWYKYIPTETGDLNISLCCSTTSNELVLSVHSGCPNSGETELACSENEPGCGLSGPMPMVDLSVTAGQTYMIRIAGEPGLDGSAAMMMGGSSGGVIYDCNTNDIEDGDDLSNCPPEDIPDNLWCRDCNWNGVPDGCDIDPSDPDENGEVSDDCNGNEIPDSCEIWADGSLDIDNNLILDVCEDCDGNGIPDGLDMLNCPPGNPACQDCNVNGLLDSCDILAGTTCDLDGDGIPDECSVCPGIDIVFLLDMSGSMGDEFEAFCQTLPQIVIDLGQMGFQVNSTVLELNCINTDLACGCIDSVCPIPIGCLDGNVYDLYGSAVPGNPSCCPISSGNEDWGPATAIVAVNHNWTLGAPGAPDNIRLIIPVSDEGPRLGDPCNNNPGDDWESIQNTIDIADAYNVIVSPIVGVFCTGANCDPTGQDCQIELADMLASGTGGKYFRSNDHTVDIALSIRGILLNICAGLTDCNGNLVPDTCEPDCNTNDIPDDCDIADGSSTDDNNNGIPDECEVQANIVVRDQFGILLSPDAGGVYLVNECDVLRLDGSDSVNTAAGGLTFAWDLDNPGTNFTTPDATGVEVLFQQTSDDPLTDFTDYVVGLQVTNDFMSSNATTVTIRVANLAPTASLSGPTVLPANQDGCFLASATSPCDSVIPADVAWDFDYDGVNFVPALGSDGITPLAGFTQCHGWSTPGTHSVAVRVTDGDLDEDIAVIQVEVQGENPEFVEQTHNLIVGTQHHTYLPTNNTPGFVRHQVEMNITNAGAAPVPDPIYLVFENLTPQNTIVIGDQAGNGPLDPNTPYIAILPDTPDGVLATETTTPGVLVEWDVPDTAAGLFSFDAVPYVHQLPPIIDPFPILNATEGIPLEFTVHAVDPEGQPIYYELGYELGDPPAVADPPLGMFLNSSTGLLTWTPSQTAAIPDPSTYTITIIARDGSPDSYTVQELTIVVTAVNVAPVITSMPDPTTITTGDPFVYTIEANDPDEDILVFPGSYALVVPPVGMQLVQPAGSSDVNIMWTPQGTGDYWIDLRVSDPSLNETQQLFLLSVVSCLTVDRPVITRDEPVGGEQAIEGEPYSKQINLQLPAPPLVYYALEIAPVGMTIDENTGCIQWLPSFNSHGNQTVRVVASTDPGGLGDCRDTWSFQVLVDDRNAPPTMLTTALPGATEGEPLIVQLEADDPDEDSPLTFLLIGEPAGMTIHPTTGILTWTPSQIAAQTNPYSMTIQVRDPSGAFDEKSFVLNVAEVNAPPVITSSPVYVTSENTDYSYPVQASDPDDPAGLSLLYALVDGPADMVMNASNELDWSTGFGSADNSPYPVIVSVSDGIHTITQPFSLVVFPLAPPPNTQAPIIHVPPYPPTHAIVGMNPGYTYQVDASDADPGDADLLFYSLENAPAGMNIGNVSPSRGVISWSPQEGQGHLQAGETYKWFNDVRIVVDDTRGAWATLSYDLLLFADDPADPNTPPQIIPEPVFTALVGEEYLYVVEGIDPDDTTLSFDLVPAPEGGPGGSLLAPPFGMDITDIQNSRLAEVSWTPTAEQIGIHWIKIEATDGAGAVGYLIYNLFVSNTYDNHPPAIVSDPVYVVRVGNEYQYQVVITDPDESDGHTYELRTKPAGATIDPIGGLLTWTPTVAQVGTHPFVVRVTDIGGAWFEQGFTVTVTEDDGSTFLNHPPDITSVPVQTVEASQLYNYNFVFTDTNANQLAPEAWTVTLEQGPLGMTASATADPNVFLISWQTQSPDNIGTYPISIRVTDLYGGWAQQDFLLFVLSNAANTVPQITTSPPLLAQMGQPYTYDVGAFDPDTSEMLTFSLETQPAGVTLANPLANPAAITWTPSAGQVGPNEFVVRVTDSTGSWAEQPFTVTVSASGQNHMPRITSSPVQVAAESTPYSYQLEAVDDDPGDVLSYTLSPDSPDDPSIDANSGLISWGSTPLPLGTHYVTARVNDSHGAWAEQAFGITVSVNGDNHAPRIISSPVTVVAVGAMYQYDIVAVDDDGNPLTWPDPQPLLPVGMTIAPNDTLAVLNWDTTNVAQGTYDITARVQDPEEAWAEQTFSITVSAGGTNHAPRIVSSPVTAVAVGAMYQYEIVAVDDDGDALTWPNPPPVMPVGMTFTTNGTNNPILDWDTSNVAVGSHDVTVRVEDVDLAFDEQSFTVQVAANQPPVITSTPPLQAIVGIEYSYQIEAVDPDDSELNFTLDTNPAPDDMGIANPLQGLLTWIPTVSGDQSVRVLVNDGSSSNNGDFQDFTVHVLSQNDANTYYPTVSVSAVLPTWASPDQQSLDRSMIQTPSNDVVAITITATDEVGILNSQTHLTITDPQGVVDDQILSLTNDIATYNFPISSSSPLGTYIVTASATDVGSLTSTDATSFGIFDSTSASDTSAPDVTITQPTDTSADPSSAPTTPELKGEVEIWGSVEDPNLFKYELSYRPVGETYSQFIVFDTGYTEMGDTTTKVVLGSLDTTMMVNGLYDIKLEAVDLFNNTGSTFVTVAVTGNAKVGNFTMSFTDLQVPVAGIPLSVTRTYDSRDKFRRDFGIGWRMELANLKIEESVPPGQNWSAVQADWNCVIAQDYAHTVSLTWPDGRVESFAINPLYAAHGGGCGLLNQITLDFPGVEFVNVSQDGRSTLQPLGQFPPIAMLPSFGILTTGDFIYPDIWQPQGYVVTAADGMVYTFGNRDPFSGISTLSSVIDLNGNEITINNNGVFHDAGPQILFQHDDQGRIVTLIDPAQKTITFDYDPQGNLAVVTDRTGHTTQFRYNNNHDLIDIIDSRGVSVARNVYDDDGRLVAHIDAEGNRVNFCRAVGGVPDPTCPLPDACDPAQPDRYEVVFNRLGQPSFFCYDENGNVLHQVDAQSHTSSNVYDPLNRLISSTDALLRTSTTTYVDDTELVAQHSDFDSNTTTFDYDENDHPIMVIDPENHVTLYDYDIFGNLEIITDPEGGVSLRAYDISGRLFSSTDRENAITSYTYDEAGNLDTETNALGQVTTYTYNAIGQRETTTRQRTLPDGTTETLVSRTEYDANGNVIRQIDPLGNIAETTYNALGKSETVTDALGNTTRSEYDLRGNLSKTIYPDGSTEEYSYDLEGRQETFTDRDGRVTKYEYDTIGNRTKTFLPDDSPGDWTNNPYTETVYDDIGRPLQVYDELRNLTEYEYEPNLQRVILHSGGQTFTTEHEYDGNGNLIRTTDANNRTTLYEYDGNGLLVKTTYPQVGANPATFSTIDYDKEGRKITETDQAGKITRYEYDLLGRLTKVIDAKLGETTYTYDELGNRLTQTDAEGRTTRMEYDALGRLTKRILPFNQEETFEYDANGNQTRHTDFNGADTLFEYDVNNRLILKTLPSVAVEISLLGGQLLPPVVTNATGQCTYQFNTDQTLLTIDCTHDVASVVGAQIQRGNIPGDPIVFNLGSGASPIQATWTLTPQNLSDLNNNLLYLVILSGSPATPEIAGLLHELPATQVVYAYTPGGLRIQAGGDTYNHDPRGRLDTETKKNGDVIRYEYDDAGNRTLVETTPDGETVPASITRYEYDGLNRLWKVYDVVSGVEVLTTTYAYDAVGNREFVIYENGTEAFHQYDELNRLTLLTNRQTADPTQIISSYTYTLGLAGNRLAVDEQSGRHVDYLYDDLYRLLSETITSDPAGNNATITYNYDKVGNRLSMSTQSGGGLVDILYTYDVNDRMLTEVRTEIGARAPPFDDGTRYARAPPKPGPTAGYFLIAFSGITLSALLVPLVLLLPRRRIGRRARRRRIFNVTVSLFVLPVMAIGADTVVAQHEQAGLYRAMTAAVLAVPGDGVTTFTYTYDDNGNTLTKGDGIDTDTFLYDFQNRLIDVDRRVCTTPTHASYTYDADGVRRGKVADGSVTYHLTDKNRPYAQVLVERSSLASGDPSIVTYDYGDDLISMTRLGSGKHYYHYDGQMSARQLSDDPSTGAPTVTDTYTYDAFGSLMSETGATVNDYRYTGEQYDPNAGFYYLRARYYNQGVGRFFIRDSFTASLFDPRALHTYLYAEANPVMKHDPSGLYSLLNVVAGMARFLISVALPTLSKATLIFRAFIGLALGGATMGYASHYLPPLVNELYLLGNTLASNTQTVSFAGSIYKAASQTRDAYLGIMKRSVLRPFFAQFGAIINLTLLSLDATLLRSRLRAAEDKIASISENWMLQKIGCSYTIHINDGKLLKRASMFGIDPARDVALFRSIVESIQSFSIRQALRQKRELIDRLRDYDIGEINQVGNSWL